MSEESMPLDTRFNEVEGGQDLYPDEKGVWNLVEEGEMKVQAAPMVHTVPCVGFVVTEKDKPGRLRAEYVRPIVERNKAGLLEQGLSDPNKIFRLLKTLQPGEAVNLPDGTLLRAEEVMEAAKQGRKIVICGDTSDASGIAALAQDCDVLVHEATNAFLLPFDKGTYMDVERFARAHGHSTPQMAGHFAHRVRAKRLIMTHFSPRYKGDLSPESLAIMKRLEDMARKTSKLRADRVLAAHDLMLVPIPSPHKMAEVGADD
ncbi:hypothetical protein Naga_100381g5 [Nannochloropsis gaditana]|uniref:Uncharacterized protein n=2 Tax=Nannochloropsis gaditana TaxID=72520 RepID=W7TFD0_9STRA|nr:hypothetical protein Naga_100381g5 [Nannochloropsis gaditana]